MFLTVAYGPRFDEYFCWQVYAILLRSFLLHYSCCSGTLISHGGTAEIGKIKGMKFPKIKYRILKIK